MDNDNDIQDNSGGARAWLERMTGRSMGDIRIHDSAQAGDLARRLGARAFTVGRDIYVRPELTNNDSPEGRALLAHEVTHAIEQTGGSTADMPLLKPQVSKGGGGPAISGSIPVQRAIDTSTPASLPASESRAESVEASAQQSGSQGGGGGGQSGQQNQQQNTQASTTTDPVELAERVYDLMVREMMIDRERSAHL